MAGTARDRLAVAAATLDASPADLDGWRELASVAREMGPEALANRIVQRTGEIASRLGQVAMAMVCAAELRDAGDDRGADELIASVARRHCRGSTSVDPTLRSTPPMPPPGSGAAPAPSDGPLQLGAVADRAFAAAEAALPGKVAPVPLVSGLARDELRELAIVARPRRCDAGTVVLDIGDPAAQLFWVARGHLEVSRDGRRLGELSPNEFFGEIALVSATERTARVTAVTDAWLLEIPSASVEKLAGRSPRLAKVLANHARARILSNVMRASGLFSRLSDDERRALLPRFEARVVDAGEGIIRAGELNDTLFVIASGAVVVRGEDEVIAELSMGAGVGEHSLLSRSPARFDVVARTPCVLLALARDAFDDLAVAHPGLLAEAYRLLVEREEEAAIVHDASDLVI